MQVQRRVICNFDAITKLHSLYLSFRRPTQRSATGRRGRLTAADSSLSRLRPLRLISARTRRRSATFTFPLRWARAAGTPPSPTPAGCTLTRGPQRTGERSELQGRWCSRRVLNCHIRSCCTRSCSSLEQCKNKFDGCMSQMWNEGIEVRVHVEQQEGGREARRGVNAVALTLTSIY